MASLRTFLDRWSKILVPSGIVLGVLGGLIFSWYPYLGGILAVVGGVTALYTWWASEAKGKEHEDFIEAQTALLARRGLGNAITETVKNELDKGGWARDVNTRLRRALELTSDDVETLELLSVSLALVLSFRSYVLHTELGPKFREAITEAEGYAKKGHELAPQSFVLLASLGILCDLEGNHEQARDYFRRAGAAGAGPSWRLYAGTSYGMEGKYPQGLAEIEKATEEGVKGWMIDWYHGRALHNVGRYDEAFYYLDRAYETRGKHPQLLDLLGRAAVFSGRWLASAKYRWLHGLTMVRFAPLKAFMDLIIAVLYFDLVFCLKLSKRLWRYTRRVPLLNRAQAKLLPTDHPEVPILLHLASQEHYDAALLLARRALGCRPENVENHERVVILLINTQHRDDALNACGRALERWPDNPRLRELCSIVNEGGYMFRFVFLQSGQWKWVVEPRNSVAH